MEEDLQETAVQKIKITIKQSKHRLISKHSKSYNETMKVLKK